MKEPEDYEGPLSVPVPYGYLDVTCWRDKKRHGIPFMDHPYYRLRDRISAVFCEYPGLGTREDAFSATEISDFIRKIMNVI